MADCQIRTKMGLILRVFASILPGPCRSILIGIDITALIGLEVVSIRLRRTRAQWSASGGLPRKRET
jgi:hypothetical protein